MADDDDDHDDDRFFFVADTHTHTRAQTGYVRGNGEYVERMENGLTGRLNRQGMRI